MSALGRAFVAKAPMRIALAPIFSAPQAVLRTAGQFLTLATVLVATACGQNFIPNTDVQDSAENRRIIEFCEEYRRAVERRNVALLFSLAHPSYYEDGGNIDASDDIDYAGLREFLDSKFKETRAIRYEVRYRRVQENKDDQTILVDYTFSASYKMPTPEGEVWRRQVADNRLELVVSGDSFKILAGM
jgi:hypothetical protein